MVKLFHLRGPSVYGMPKSMLCNFIFLTDCIKKINNFKVVFSLARW